MVLADVASSGNLNTCSSKNLTNATVEENPTSSSSYLMASQSRISNDVDRWIRGSTENTGIQNSRIYMVQRSMLAAAGSLGISGVWYMLATLPIFSINNPNPSWICSPSTVLNALELFFGQLSAACDLVRARIRRISRDQEARAALATLLDAILMVYAISFFILAMYQIAMIGRQHTTYNNSTKAKAIDIRIPPGTDKIALKMFVVICANSSVPMFARDIPAAEGILLPHIKVANIWIDSRSDADELEDVEKRYTPELMTQLQIAKDEALLLYTEYTGHAGLELNHFLKEMTGFAHRTMASLDPIEFGKAPDACKNDIQKKLLKVENDAKLSASFSGLNHHKYLLGHMVVFRMHLNKSEDFINKCTKVIGTCGIACETTPRVRRWRRHAADELNRVRQDIQSSRRSYKDIVLHAHRHLLHLRKQAATKAKEIISQFFACH
ncbi:hypothetical protein ACJJTC_016789 [Scirpophaga incertulas]